MVAFRVPEWWLSYDKVRLCGGRELDKTKLGRISGGKQVLIPCYLRSISMLSFPLNEFLFSYFLSFFFGFPFSLLQRQ